MTRLQALHRAEGAPGGADQRTLLERVHTFVYEGSAGGEWVKADWVAERFRGTKADTLQGVLHFLVRSGLVEVKGRGRSRAYRGAEPNSPGGPNEHDAAVLLYREGPMSLEVLSTRLDVPAAEATALLERVRAHGWLVETQGEDDTTLYRVERFHIPMDTVAGYEAAIYDHLSAVVRALCKKLRLGRHNATLHEFTGGSTFTFLLPEGDPLHAEITAYLKTNRLLLEAWLARADTLRAATPPGTPMKRVTIYVGQMVEDDAP